MENLKVIINRLASDPENIASLIKSRAIASDELHLQLDNIQVREVKIAGDVASRRKSDGNPVFPNRELRDAEALRLLTADADYFAAKNLADKARNQMRELDAAIESATRRNNSDVQIVGLVTALLNAGKHQEASEVAGSYCCQPAAAQYEPNQQQVKAEASAADLGTTGISAVALVDVLEARPSKTTPGTIRAYCQAEDGNKVAVYAKNGNGQALLSAVGKKVHIEYQKVDRGWFAYKVLIIAA
jgi:hypothetical protein